jgi:hypothetical protein
MPNGVTLINQQREIAGNITPRDLPGFLLRINMPGSY